MEKILLNYLKDNPKQWFKKVELYILADEVGYSPETCGRCLRDLANQKRIYVDYYNGKYSRHLAKYSYNPNTKKRKVEIINNKAYITYV